MAGFALSNALNFAPGTRKGYSNAGYLVLGLIIEQVTGQGYEDAVRQLVMTPLGITRAHLTATRRADQRPGAVRHHAGGMGQPDLSLGPSAVEEWAIRCSSRGPACIASADHSRRTPTAVVTTASSTPLARGALASADFARILASFERTPNPLLGTASVTEMTTPVVIPGFTGWEAPFALGWFVTPGAGDTMIGHGGNLGGMKPSGTRSSAGWSVTALQNSDAGGLGSVVEAALRALPLGSWPANDSWASAQLPAW